MASGPALPRIISTSDERCAKESAKCRMPILRPIAIAVRSFSVSGGMSIVRCTVTALFWPTSPPLRILQDHLVLSFLHDLGQDRIEVDADEIADLELVDDVCRVEADAELVARRRPCARQSGTGSPVP